MPLSKKQIAARKEADKLLKKAFIIGIKQPHNKDLCIKILNDAKKIAPDYYRIFVFEALLTENYEEQKYYELLKQAKELQDNQGEPESLYVKYHIIFEEFPDMCPDPGFRNSIQDSIPTKPEDILAKAQSAGRKLEVRQGAEAGAAKSLEIYDALASNKSLQKDVIFQYYFGVYANLTKNPKQSEEIHEKLTKIAPEIPQIWERFAEALFFQQKFTEAEKAILKAIELLKESKADTGMISSYYAAYGVYLAAESKAMEKSNIAEKKVIAKVSEAAGAFYQGLKYDSGNQYIKDQIAKLFCLSSPQADNTQPNAYEEPASNNYQNPESIFGPREKEEDHTYLAPVPLAGADGAQG